MEGKRQRAEGSLNPHAGRKIVSCLGSQENHEGQTLTCDLTARKCGKTYLEAPTLDPTLDPTRTHLGALLTPGHTDL